MKSTKKIVMIALYSASLVALKMALMWLPNVELVTFLMIIYGLTLPFDMTIMISFIFVLIEALIWGVGDWVIGYIWIWPLWVVLVYLMKPLLQERRYGWAIVSGLWGFLFGVLFALNHGLLYGFNYSFVYWLKGINFDLIHVISNYIVTLILFQPVLNLLKNQHKEGEKI